MADNLNPPLVAEKAIGDLITALEASVPAIMEELADLLGKRAPRLPSAERRRFTSSLRRRLKRLWPAFQELDTLKTAPESSQKTETIKAALRGILVEMFAPPKIRKSPDAGRLGWLIQAAAAGML
jgi:hypothetical protein